MKKLIIFLVLITCTLTINSQTFEAKPFDFIWTADSIPKPLVLDSFSVNSFLLGFQWSGTPRMNKALRHNANAGGKYEYEPSTFDGANLIHIISQPSEDAQNSKHVQYTDAHYIQYEPTLYTNDYTKFKPRFNDPTNAIFGFSNIYGTILSKNQFADTNYNRLILHKDSLSIYPADSIVLSGINPNDKFETYRGDGQHGGFTGEKWNLSINLRRLQPHIDQSFSPTDTVLVIRLPYVSKDTFGIVRNKFINFDEVPKTNVHSDTISLDYYQYRGYALDNIPNTTLQNQLVITKAMLDTNRVAPDITISAHFSLYQDSMNLIPALQKYYNPRFHPGFEDIAHALLEFEQIQNIDIEVKYYGNCDIAIDWLRIETDKAQNMLRGKYDDDGFYSGSYILQSFLDTIPKIKHNGQQQYKIQRFYAQDSEKSNPVFWGQLRYYNLITNNLTITRDNPYLPNQYNYYTRSQNRYLGMKISENGHSIAVPFFRTTVSDSNIYTRPDWKTLGYKYGFRGEHWADTLTSGYETFLSNWSLGEDPLIFNNIKSLSYTDYFEHAWRSTSIQVHFENYYNGLFQNEDNYHYMYTGNPWYMNLFIGSNVGRVTLGTSGIVPNPMNIAAKIENLRAKTGEEIRLLMNANIIMGAKGILYDREENSTINPNIFFGLGNGNVNVDFDINNLDAFAYNDTVGGDFPNGIADVYNYSYYLAKDTISKYNMISPNRIYVGVKSTRTEIKHVNDWVRLNDLELMDLRLQATYSKGFRIHENFNPYKFNRWSSSPLRKIVDLANVRTRKIFEPKHTMIHNTNPDYEFIDSSFFDITLLQHKNNTDTDIFLNKNAVYLGVMNRRTDPLIFRDSIDFYTQDSLRELMFFTTSEFDDKVRFGGMDLWGVNQDSTWWQNQWWKRLGVREIKIPLNIKPYGNGTYILAQEIGIDSLDLLGWRYDEKYYQRIDTTLTYRDSLMTKLLPGQGKIIKLDFVPYFFNDPTKDSIPENDSCYFCDIYNNFDLFEFFVTANTGEETGCCYDVELKYNGNCKFEDIPFRLIFEGESSNTFEDSNFPGTLIDSSGTSIKYKNYLYSFDSTVSTISMGSFCISDSSNKYKISLLAGKDKNDKFIGCDREMQFEVNCDIEDEPKDCCEGLNVADSMYSYGISPYDPYSGTFCTKLKVDTGFDSDCIFGISIAGEGVQRSIVPLGLDPINFTTGSGQEFTLCYNLKPCNDSGTISPAIRMVKMQFLGKNGTVVCEIDVPLWLPCLNMQTGDFEIGDPTGPALKSNKPNDKMDSKTYESDSFKVTIWPNPTSGELNVEIDSKVDTEVDINFISNIGASITNVNGVTINKGVNEKTYNLKNYSSGVYYLQINGKDGNIVLPIMLNK